MFEYLGCDYAKRVGRQEHQQQQNIKMDVDIDNSSSNPLKRYRSEPSINIEQGTSATSDNCSPASDSSNTSNSLGPNLSVRILNRRFSMGHVGLMLSPTTSSKTPSRLDQIKLEESIGQTDREAAHEKEIQSAIVMTQSWEELSIDDAEAMATDVKRPRSFAEPLHVYTSMLPIHSGSSSPTRVGKQCFSPSLQQTIKDCTFAPSPPGSSPTRQTCVRRSLSPIVLRPSPLSAVKRKIDTEDRYQIFSPAKRFHGTSTPTRLLSSERFLSSCQPLQNSGSEDTTSGDEQTANVSSERPFEFVGCSSNSGLLSTSASSAFTFQPFYHSFKTSGKTSSETSSTVDINDPVETDEAAMLNTATTKQRSPRDGGSSE